ncbi:LacI family DNA-binding transcriptional regulator [Streptomyces sp. NPDC048430]|uniref:LacI family DNA-binding transcriptional regulator n=1 Tax=Streptomyces sp. NPDC048430 TaxID=3155388 RepID=UPI003447E0C3
MSERARRGDVGVVDLARELGVSTATVSRALTGSPAVRPALAARIREHADARGYVANRLARGLSATTSRAFVGFVIPYVDTPAYSAVAAECARLLSREGTQVILTITENDPDRELQQLRELVATRIAGLIISPSTKIRKESRRILAGVPVVELHRAGGIEAPGVFSDDTAVMAEAVAHLVALGHREIAYLGTPRGLSNGALRWQAVEEAMTRAGIDPERMPVRMFEPTRTSGFRGATELLADPARPTALLVASGSLSVGAAEAVRHSGRRLPEDLSLIVYGDPAWFALSDPPLTTIRVSYDRIAREAARLLNSALDGDVVQRSSLVRPELCIAGSTGPAPDRERQNSPGGRQAAQTRRRS